MPSDFDIQMGSNKLIRRNITIRGTDETVSFPIWDYVDKCTSLCAVSDQCPYMTQGNCKVQYQYMKAVLELVQNEFVGTTADQLFHIGMHLIPLYQSLCKMKLVAASLTSMTYETLQGGVRVHPIYKEIREQLKLINDVWKGLELKKQELKRADIPSYEWMTGDGEPVMIQDGSPLSKSELAGAEGMARPEQELPDMSESVMMPTEDVDDSPIGDMLAKKPAVKKKVVVPRKWKK